MVKPALPAPGSALRSATRAAFWTLTALALPACVLATAAYFTSQPAVLAQLSPFRVQAFVLLAAHAAFCLALRRLRWASVFAAFALFNLGVVFHATHVFAPPRPAPPSALAPTKVLLANVLTSNPDPAPLLALIAAEQPDLVALLEINARWQTQLTASLAADYPHRLVRAREDNFGLAVFSRVPFASDSVDYFADDELPSLHFNLPRPEGELRVLLTHPLPPGDAETTRLRDQHLADLVDWFEFVTSRAPRSAPTPASPVLILGDLNATPWCPPLRRLLAATGLRPAARATTAGSPPPGPRRFPFFAFPSTTPS